MQQSKPGVSKRIFAVTTIILIVVAAGGYALYASTVLKQTKTRIGVAGGILNGKIVSFQFFESFSCTPSITSLFPNNANATAAASVTSCEIGAPGTFPSNTIPVWGMVPAFAGLSVFGVTSFGATPTGYPSWNNITIFTDCTGNGSVNKCPDHPPLFFSPAIVAVENYLNFSKGVMNLPEGVMPFPAHTHLVETDAGQADIPWDAIGVFVFDPNIFPTPTGTCSQIAPSSLTNATSNCLISTSALKAAMATQNSALSTVNAKNPIWNGLGQPPYQVVIAGATSQSQYANANSNVDVPFAVIDSNPFPPYYG